MHTFVTLGNMIVNLTNVVAFDAEGGIVRKIFYVGCPTPIEMPTGVSAAQLSQFLQAKGDMN
jgi:hypothetical protein